MIAKRLKGRMYPIYFMVPALAVYIVIFIIPTFSSFFYSFTKWTLTDWEFIGWDNYKTFFSEPSLRIGLKNTLIYGFGTSFGKVVIALLLAVLLTRGLKIQGYLRTVIFFPTLLSALAVGFTFKSLMHPTTGLINNALGVLGVGSIHWLTNDKIALFSVMGIDIWKGLGVATLIYITGIQSIPKDYYEAAKIDGASAGQSFRFITLPLIRTAMNSVITLSLIGGLRNFDLVYSTTGGGPGFATELMTTVTYRMFAAGLYGLSTVGNVVLFLIITAIAFPLYGYLGRKEVEM